VTVAVKQWLANPINLSRGTTVVKSIQYRNSNCSLNGNSFFLRFCVIVAIS